VDSAGIGNNERSTAMLDFVTEYREIVIGLNIACVVGTAVWVMIVGRKKKADKGD
jgi:hypothetical protein